MTLWWINPFSVLIMGVMLLKVIDNLWTHPGLVRCSKCVQTFQENYEWVKTKC